jgi:hypothetical protein
MWEKRIAPLSGLAFAVLVVIGAVIVNNYEFMPTDESVVDFYGASSRRVMVGAYVGLLASFFLVWFSGSIRQKVRALAGGSDRLAIVAFGGGITAAAAVILSSVANSYAAERVMINGVIDPGGATAAFDLYSGLMGSAVPIGLGAMTGAYAVAYLRGERARHWPGWLSLVIALGLVSPVNWAVMAVGVIWVAVVSVDQYRNPTEDSPVDVTALERAT